MATSYLTLVNDVLVRLRESTVATVSENEYSALIGKLVNDAKREVEDAWEWEALKTTISVNTVANTVSYILTDSGTKFKIYEVINDTENLFVEQKSNSFITENVLLADTPKTGRPDYYAVNGNDSSGDLIVDVFPIPDGVYTLRFNGYAAEPELSSDTDTTNLSKAAIVSLAWAKAIEERGEDGGISVSSQYGVAKQALGDAIAIESGRKEEELIWYSK